jgi:hypothetical protein
MDRYKAILEQPELCRVSLAKEDAPLRVESDSGDYNAGIIRDVAAMTEGEALGHGAWVDEAMLDQVVQSGNAQRSGVKVRFTHPGLSSDGLGTLLGRFKKFRREDNKAVGDLHFLKSSHDTPSGDLANYIMALAEESPDMVAMSIVFERDIGAEKEFEGVNSDEDGVFTSPDRANTKNLPHFRLSRLRGVDVVDEPAANPEGLFAALNDGNQLPLLAEQALDYAFRLKNEAPSAELLGIHPDRIKTFLQDYLRRRELRIESDVSITLPPGEAAAHAEDSTTTGTSGNDRWLDKNPWAKDDLLEIKDDIEANSETIDENEDQEKGGPIMDLKEATLEQLQTERSDLVEAVRDEAFEEANATAEADKREALAAQEATVRQDERVRCIEIVAIAHKYDVSVGVLELLRSGADAQQATIQLQAAKIEELNRSETQLDGAEDGLDALGPNASKEAEWPCKKDEPDDKGVKNTDSAKAAADLAEDKGIPYADALKEIGKEQQ